MVAGSVDPLNGVWVRARAVRPGAEHDPAVCKVAQRVQTRAALAEDLFQIGVRLLRPVDERALHREQDVVLPADLHALGGRQAGVDDGVAVVGARVIVQRGFQRARRLVECRVADGVHLDLQPGAVRLLAERRNLLVAIVQHALVVAHFIRCAQRGVPGAEAAVQRRFEAAADARQAAFDSLVHVHRLEIHAHLHAVVQPAGKPALQIHVQIAGKAHAADAVDHADALGRHVVRRVLHIPHKLHGRHGIRDVIRDREKRLLIHLAGVFMIPAQPGDFLLHLVQQRGVDDARMAVVFDQKQRLVRADPVQLPAGDELALRHGVRRRAEGDHQLFLRARDVFPQHLQNLRVALRLHHVQPGVEGRKAGKMNVAVRKGGNERLLAQLDQFGRGIFARLQVADIDDPSPILHQILCDGVLRVAGQNCAVIQFHKRPFSVWVPSVTSTRYFSSRHSGWYDSLDLRTPGSPTSSSRLIYCTLSVTKRLANSFTSA